MLAYTSALLTFAPAPLNPSCGGGAAVRSSAQPTPTMAVDLEALAKSQNPVLGYWDPLQLAELDFWEEGNAATIGAPKSPTPPLSLRPSRAARQDFCATPR